MRCSIVVKNNNKYFFKNVQYRFKHRSEIKFLHEEVFNSVGPPAFIYSVL